MKTNINKANGLIIIFLCMITITLSCKKEYTEYPYNEIEQFTINDAKGNELKATIKNDSLIVYWPPLQDVPDSIAPSIITISDRAVVSPASGKKVAFNKNTTYKVTAQDGSIKIYKLIPIVNQPVPSAYIGDGEVAWSVGASRNLMIRGEYLIPDTNKTKVYLIDSISRKEYKVDLSNPVVFGNGAIGVTIPFDGKIEPSVYDVKVITGSYTILLKQRFQLLPPNPFDATYLTKSFVCNERAKQVKQGGDITYTYSLTGSAAKYYKGKFSHALVTRGSVFTAPVVSQTDNLITFRLPDNITIGKITKIELYNSAYLNTSRKAVLFQSDQITAVAQQPTVIAK